MINIFNSNPFCVSHFVWYDKNALILFFLKSLLKIFYSIVCLQVESIEKFWNFQTFFILFFCNKKFFYLSSGCLSMKIIIIAFKIHWKISYYWCYNFSFFFFIIDRKKFHVELLIGSFYWILLVLLYKLTLLNIWDGLCIIILNRCKTEN